MDALPSVPVAVRTYVRLCSGRGRPADPELVENRRRSIAMLPAGAPALNRDEALVLLRQLEEALREVRELRRRIS
jgi:hypothetical protein